MNVEKYLFNIASKKIKFGLSRTIELLKACNNPEKDTLSIQVVGTNGKGSVSAFLAKPLVDKGYKVGLYTSPHLVDYKERIRINFNKISENSIKKFLKKYSVQIEQIKPSFFELMTAIAVWYFKHKKVDIAVLETGLGGRLDSVTACDNKYLLFTSISLDHQNILGSSINKIAKEKGGAIINSKQKCIGINQIKKIENVLIKEAKKVNNNIKFISDECNPFFGEKFKYLKGKHQHLNALLAYKALEELIQNKTIKINRADIIKSFKETQWPGRFQIIKKTPAVIYDVAHNKEGLNSFIETFKKLEYKERKILILAFEDKKQIKDTIRKFKNIFDCIVCTETNIRKSMPANQIFGFIESNKAIIIKDVDKAIKYAFNLYKEDVVISIVGSHFLAPYIDNYYENCFAIDK